MSIRERWGLINGAAQQDSALVDLMIEQGMRYIWLPEKRRIDLDTAVILSTWAWQLSNQIDYAEGRKEASLLAVKAFIAGRQLDKVNDMIRKSPRDLVSVHATLLVGQDYLERPGSNQTDLDSALRWFNKARALSRSLKYQKGERESLRMIAKYHFESGDIAAGKKTYLDVIRQYHAENNIFDEADWWIDLGYRIPDRDSTFPEKITYMTNALDIYQQLRDNPRAQWVLGARAEVYRRQGNLNMAEDGFLQVLNLQKIQGDRYLQNTYYTLMDINLYRGDYNKALAYGIACVQYIDHTGDSTVAPDAYEKLGTIYSQLTDHDRSIEWYKKALVQHEKNTDKEHACRINYFLTKELIKAGLPREALTILNRSMKNYPPKEPLNRELMAGAFADCYAALKQYQLAEKYYREMIYLENLTRSGNQISAMAYYSIGKFYLDREQYQQADGYLDTALTITPGRMPLSIVKDIHFMLFKTDSVLNRYEQAINHLRTFQGLSDSIFNATRIRQLEELQVRYETSQKEKDILLLRQKSELQQKQIEQSNLLKRVTFGSIILLILLLLLSVNRYRLKQRSMRQLAMQQKEITDKNVSLQRLLKEKEWLIKEVHHRVKNNLQIVMSLLNTQSNFLESEAALAAIKDSAHRMQSISLIHQKLYQSEYLSLVNMPSYIHELVHYLEDSYRGVRRIYFDMHIAPIDLDVSQAVPMGLILSEAVTNAIKYAFPDDRAGCITISLDYVAPEHLLLMISDNGAGLPADVDFAAGKSLGVRLIQTFSAQLEGELSIESKDGLTIRLLFRQQ
ncbi:histidine kinase dimerization/phosphoacceptor domain -containing protein [Chitinophaga sp. S165]|uniref:tetratricopeptide repeat-containing sensor histidine kinase n=1 Tax=Chitinophaga sp. S165 TaxID=2135462 RepID=UPI001304BE65|nr:histidine kinase dimerization/phosphoacceptor domain -containing protein [Chitinophaga sp. S165]